MVKILSGLSGYSIGLAVVLVFFCEANPCADGASKEVVIGEETYVCVILSDLNWFKNESYLRVVARPMADELSSINIRNVWSSTEYHRDTALAKLKVPFEVGSGMGITVASMGKLSYQTAFRYVVNTESGKRGITFPLLMATVFVDKGVVTGITWDSSCSWCEPDHCRDSIFDFNATSVSEGKNCWVSDSSCTSDSGTTRLCELNVHITWTGTDAQNRYFLSATPRFSRMSSNQLIEFTDDLDAEERVVTFDPTGQPTSQPSTPTEQPTGIPTSPTGEPSSDPTAPSYEPTIKPSLSPSFLPTPIPSQTPSLIPSVSPTCEPTVEPSMGPTESPSE